MLMSACHLYLERRDPALNMARFYRLCLQPTLFGEVVLLREWGRIGTGGQRISQCYDRETEALAALLALARRKRARGYRSRASFASPVTKSAGDARPLPAAAPSASDRARIRPAPPGG
nr:WGR domain-containing protein [uncultured Gellertiella sp.]